MISCEEHQYMSIEPSPSRALGPLRLAGRASTPVLAGDRSAGAVVGSRSTVLGLLAVLLCLGLQAGFRGNCSAQAFVSFLQPLEARVEGEGTTTFEVVRTGSTALAGAVDFAVTPGTALTGRDFQPVSGTLAFAPGQVSGLIEVILLDDGEVEDSETFFIELSHPSPGTAIGTYGHLTVRLHVNEIPTVLDGLYRADPGADWDVFAVALQPDGALVVGGAFTNLDGHAASAFGRLRPDGSADPAFHPGGGASASVYAVAVQVDGRILLGGDFTSVGGQPAQYLARLDPDGSPDPTFRGASSLNGAVRALVLQPDGRILVGGRFTSVEGAPRGYFARLLSDGQLDGSFGTGTGANSFVRAIALETNSGAIWIGGVFSRVDGEPRGRAARLGRDGAVDPAFRPGLGFDGEVRAILSDLDGGAVLGGDFTHYDGTSRPHLARLLATGSLDPAFSAGTVTNGRVRALARQADGRILVAGAFSVVQQASRSGLARVLRDGTFDPEFGAEDLSFDDELFSLAIQQDGKIVAAGQFTGVRRDDDRNAASRLARFFPDRRQPALCFKQSPSVVSEGSGSDLLLSTLFRSGTTTGTVSVAYHTVDGTAVQGQDYQAVARTVVLPPFKTRTNLEVRLLGDLAVEGTENFFLQIGSPSPGTVFNGVTNLEVQILDNDSGIAFSSEDYTVREDAGSLVVKVERLDATNLLETVQFSTADWSAVAPQDYVPTNGVLTFLPGETSKEITVLVKPDQVGEETELLRLQLSNSSIPNRIRTPLGWLSLVNTTVFFEFAAPETLVSEGPEPGTNEVCLLVRRGGGVELEQSVQWSIGPLTATFGDDLVGPRSGTLVFEPGVSLQCLQIPLRNDGVVEPLEEFVVHLSGASAGAVLGAGSNTLVRVQDNDAGIEFTQAEFAAAESSGRALITVRRGDDGLNPVTVDYRTAPALSVEGVDYLATNGTLLIPAGQKTGTFCVVVLRDCRRESEQTVSLVLENPTGGASLGAASTALLRILDDGPGRPGSRDLSLPDVAAAGPVAVQPDGRILVGGVSVGFVQEPATVLVRLLPDGTPDASWSSSDAFSGMVTGHSVRLTALEVQPDGRVLVAGLALGFSVLNGMTTNFVLRLRIDGSLDPGFHAVLADSLPFPFLDNHWVETLAVQSDGRILIGGHFEEVSGQPRLGLARLLEDGSLDPGFPADLFDPSAYGVLSMKLQPDQRILIGGNFTRIRGVGRNGVARLLPDGRLDSTFDPGGGAAVSSLALQPDGKVVLGGMFTEINGLTQYGIARLLPDGGLDPGFALRAGSDHPYGIAQVQSVTLQFDGLILVAGAFNEFNGQSRPNLVRLFPDGSLDTEFFLSESWLGNSAGPVVIQPDGQILVVNPQLGLRRLQGEPTLRLELRRGAPGAPFKLAFMTRPGARYLLQGSADLRNWRSLGLYEASGCRLEITPPAGLPAAGVFYRVAKE